MKAIIIKMIKEVLIDGLQISGCDLEKTQIRYPRGGLFTNKNDINRAYQIAKMKLDLWSTRKKAGDKEIPNTINEFVRLIDIQLAEQSFLDAAGKINSPLSDRPNSELVTEMKDALEVFRKYGCKDKLSSYKFLMDQRIGKE
jgi:hypothetical protein